MRLITAAFHTTPTMAMEMALGFESVDIKVAMEAVNAAIRLKNEGMWRDKVKRGHGSSHGRLCEDLIRGIAGLNKEADWISPSGIERKRYRIIIQDRQRAMAEEASTEEAKMYTDGSRMGNKTGMGFLIQVPGEEEVEVSVPLGETPTVYQAEVGAITYGAVETIIRGIPRGMSLTIFSDNQACLKALERTSTRSKMIEECHLTLNRLARERMVTLRWIPGHQGVEGNERADDLAKQGAWGQKGEDDPDLPVSRQWLKRRIKEWGWKSFKKRWKESRGMRQSKLSLGAEGRKDREHLLQMDRKTLRQVFTVITGHGNIGKHLKTMGVIRDSLCPKCGAGEETVGHYLGRCGAYALKRFECFNRGQIREDEIIKQNDLGKDWSGANGSLNSSLDTNSDKGACGFSYHHRNGIPSLVHYDLPKKLAEADATNPMLSNGKGDTDSCSESNVYQSIEDLKKNTYETVKVIQKNVESDVKEEDGDHYDRLDHNRPKTEMSSNYQHVTTTPQATSSPAATTVITIPGNSTAAEELT
ncbi:unnamed protein product [Cyprideis torosa]|uniref:ribonuclease H n=1 Tax=Cyprideis torosa TaxID=163714 RepID=A0A7R8W8I0_9CRUS|nr:unnamed protein product [Cyprideis torosa]CAG0888607.1 unnamed protein product [Cyprideis torosa]